MYKIKLFSHENLNKLINICENENKWSEKNHGYQILTTRLCHISDNFASHVENIIAKHLLSLNIGFRGFLDLFIIKYTPGKLSSLPWHIDPSPLSFVCVLNDNFTGGGTEFRDLNENISQEKGYMILHDGQEYHRAKCITKGVRYVLVGFLWNDLVSKLKNWIDKDHKRSSLLKYMANDYSDMLEEEINKKGYFGRRNLYEYKKMKKMSPERSKKILEKIGIRFKQN